MFYFSRVMDISFAASLHPALALKRDRTKLMNEQIDLERERERERERACFMRSCSTFIVARKPYKYHNALHSHFITLKKKPKKLNAKEAKDKNSKCSFD